MIDLQATAPRHKTSFLRRASLAALEHLTFLDDATYLKMRYALKMGKRLDLDDPKTFNEKLQWLKLHDRNPLYTTLVDKAAVKPWVAERIGWEHVVPTLGVWDSFDKIDFDELPERFVLKCTHDSGGLAICRDRATFDMDAARKKIEKSLRRNYYFHGREWPYKDVCPRVLAEEYLDSPATSEITDYKLMCFNGRARCAFTCTGRAGGDLRVDFFDLDWNRLPFTRHYSASDVPPEAPLRLHEMVGISERLAKGMPFVRVDFYEVAGETYFGELTFYPGNGMEEFDPEQWDEELGSWVTLPNTFGGVLLMADDALLWLHCLDVAPTPVGTAGLVDYKFYCFGGEPRFLYVSQGLEDHATARISFLSFGWNFEPYRRGDYAPFEELPEKPGSFTEMLRFAKLLSEGIPFVRADFYDGPRGRCSPS